MEQDSEKNQKLGPVMSGPVTHMLTVSHQKSRIFFPPIPGSKAFGTPLRRLYRPVSSFWEGRRKKQLDSNAASNHTKNIPGGVLQYIDTVQYILYILQYMLNNMLILNYDFGFRPHSNILTV